MKIRVMATFHTKGLLFEIVIYALLFLGADHLNSKDSMPVSFVVMI